VTEARRLCVQRDASRPTRRHLDRKTAWRLVKTFRRAAGFEPDRLGGRGIGIRGLRKTAINDAICSEASIHEVREFAGHADIVPPRSVSSAARSAPRSPLAASRSA
jgi:hypothetical protein